MDGPHARHNWASTRGEGLPRLRRGRRPSLRLRRAVRPYLQRSAGPDKYDGHLKRVNPRIPGLMRTHRRTRAPPHQRRRRADGNASQEEERTRQRLRCRNAKYVIIPHKDRRRIGSHFFFINPAGEQVGRMPPPPLLSSHAYKKSFNYTLILSLSLSLSPSLSLSLALSLPL